MPRFRIFLACTRCKRLADQHSLRAMRVREVEFRLCEGCWRSWLEWLHRVGPPSGRRPVQGMLN